MRVLITGAARAIGAATARVLTAHGCDVVATARDPHLLANVPAALRLPLDVTDQQSVDACIEEASDIDVVVNNAAISEAGPLERYPRGSASGLLRNQHDRRVACDPSSRPGDAPEGPRRHRQCEFGERPGQLTP